MFSEAKCLRRMHGLIIDLWPLVSESDSYQTDFYTDPDSQHDQPDGAALVKSLLWSLSIYYVRSIETQTVQSVSAQCITDSLCSTSQMGLQYIIIVKRASKYK